MLIPGSELKERGLVSMRGEASAPQHLYNAENTHATCVHRSQISFIRSHLSHADDDGSFAYANICSQARHTRLLLTSCEVRISFLISAVDLFNKREGSETKPHSSALILFQHQLRKPQYSPIRSKLMIWFGYKRSNVKWWGCFRNWTHTQYRCLTLNNSASRADG